MTGKLVKRNRLSLIALFTALGVVGAASACPFCSMQGQTLTQEVNQASMVLFGTLADAKLDATGGLGQGTTDLRVEAVLKSNAILGNQKVITLPRYLPTDNTSTKFLIFCDVFKGKIDPYRGVPVKAEGDTVKYLQGAMAVKDKDVGTRLRFFFDYLDNAEQEISIDAYKEFGNADYKDYREMAQRLPPDRIAKWLREPETPTFRYGLYASMLGHCGGDQHARLLRKMLDDPDKRLNSGVDGILAGYTMLKPKEGWAYIRGILGDPGKDFMLRYAGLRTIRFFHDSRPDLVPATKLVEGVSALLSQTDIADLAIEELRKWGSWDTADRILALYGQKSHDVPIIKKAIIRFALSCPLPKTSAFVRDVRRADPETVKDIEELLKLETAEPNGKPVAGAKGS